MVISDPVWSDQRLLVISLSKSSDEQDVLRLLTLDRATGHVVGQRELVQLSRHAANGQRCEIAKDDEGLVVDLGSALLRLDGDGNIVWLRLSQQMETQSEAKRNIVQQPLIHGSQLLVASRGGDLVDCLNLQTGQRMWTAEMKTPVRLAGQTSDSVVVFASDSVIALALHDGSAQWRLATRPLAALPLVGQRHVLVAETNKVDQNEEQYQITWTLLDAVTGSALQSTVLSDWMLSQPRLGSVLPFRGGVLCLSLTTGGQFELTALQATAGAQLQIHRDQPLASLGQITGTGGAR
jgi:hypothetical protein